ncbi:uncharacterized protein FPRO_14354 [Fusarium proliferatum ET1]|uniref:Uncharacterized protein n=1 Tax=Fusarium proliferatum (strain ET1) TaxID=1227346 RepID=A0A1L7VXB7_FUSPR|nr:uncharacterized protein FPRO_14354 [Fusarium proliferatum ET1]CZR44601.1 uncharacterized protein FPRO_14354 [Fusarium proliferatum ET1]
MTPDASAAVAASASTPSSSPTTPWCGLLKPKRLHYDNELSVDAKSIAVLEDEIAICTRHDLHWECIADKYHVPKKEVEAQADAAASDAEKLLEDARKSLEEEAAAGLEPNTYNVED